MNIPLVDIAAQQAEVHDVVLADVEEVLRSASFVGGQPVSEFEREYAEFCGVSHCVGVGNGTDAIELALRAIGVRAGQEVVVPANTFVATAEAVCRIGAVPRLVDVDPEHLLMDPERLADAIGPRTAAVVPVHLFGQMAPLDELLDTLRGTGVPLVEDAAQSQGATRHGRSAGSVGRAAATSFYPGKNLGAAGDAGAVTTADADVARAVRLLGAHGSEVKYVHESLGFNSRLDTIQAVVLRAKLHRLKDWNEARRRVAQRYEALLDGVDGIRLPHTMEGNEHVWHLYVVRVDDRDRVLAQLHSRGIGAGVHYPQPVHLTPAFAGLGYSAGSFPVAEAAAGRILSLPMYPHLSADDQDRVVSVLTDAVRSR